MANKHMRSCPTPLAITGMQIEPTMRYRYTLRRMGKRKRAQGAPRLRGDGDSRSPARDRRGVKVARTLWEKSRDVSRQVQQKRAARPVISEHRLRAGRTGTHVRTNTRGQKFTAAVPTMAPGLEAVQVSVNWQRGTGNVAEPHGRVLNSLAEGGGVRGGADAPRRVRKAEHGHHALSDSVCRTHPEKAHLQPQRNLRGQARKTEPCLTGRG